ncbi:hypothetical protein PIB30_052913 [Stylosanthes scabra]|uniref:Uncharacterized protein n=1 Tax=Stylosanthes scabra TaxID=79078 RepID=A0ABU6UJ65_9FABA|nr:hypothetical protein [Stylosanthes scabra]
MEPRWLALDRGGSQSRDGHQVQRGGDTGFRHVYGTVEWHQRCCGSGSFLHLGCPCKTRDSGSISNTAAKTKDGGMGRAVGPLLQCWALKKGIQPNFNFNI